MKFNPVIRYRVGGAEIECRAFETEHFAIETSFDEKKIELSIIPKTELELIEVRLESEYNFNSDERFFVNGYQAWTTSREYVKNDIQKGLFPIGNLSAFTKDLAGISGDYLFTRYGGAGYFHSFTYTYFRLANELTLFGSLSERNGYTVFYADIQKNFFSIEKDVEGLVVNEEYKLFDIVILKGNYDEVFDSYFGKMELRRPAIEHLSGYTSWYNYFQKIDENIILRDLNGLDRAQDSVSIFQIDDGYQNAVGDWLIINSEKFPNGMKPIADKIHEKGYLAGIWLAPFNAQKSSQIRKEHPEWLILNNRNGKPLLGCVGWGGADTFDLYNPEFRAHLKHVFDVILNDWGFDMVKLDFLYSQAMQPRNGKTRGTIMCEAMDFLRECVGDKLLLGCGVPLAPAFGTVDACRISCDVDLKYEGKFYNKMHVNAEIPSAQNAINNTIFRRHLDKRVFCNDPDVFFLRETNLTFTKEQKLLLAEINHLFGNVLFVSDNAGDFPQEDIDYLKRFFARSEAKIISAEYVDAENVVIEFIEKETEKALKFNMKTGKSNIHEIL